jgi:hypothetical protein
MFEAIMSHGEAFYKNNKNLNFDNIKIKKINKTSHVITGSFVIGKGFDEFTSVKCKFKFMTQISLLLAVSGSLFGL